MYLYSFEKLEVWQNSRKLAKQVYTTTESFPVSEQFGLTNQLRRSVVSVCSNLAEGSARRTKMDQGKFTTQSYSSLMEVLNQLILGSDFGYLSAESLSSFREQILLISNQLNALRNAQMGTGG